MVTAQHEALHQIFQQRPEVFAQVGRKLGVKIPETKTAKLFPTDATEVQPVERRIDCTFEIETLQQGKFLVLLEVQRKKQEDKPSTWLYYQAYMQERHKMPTMLMVLCPNEGVADWAAGPHQLGADFHPTATLRPFVLGAKTVPKFPQVEPDYADIVLGAISAVVHRADPEFDAMAEALASAMGAIGWQKDMRELSELVEVGLEKTPAKDIWRRIMSVDTSFYQSETSQELREEGRTQQLAEVVLDALRLRHVELSDAERQRVLGCSDRDQLGVWFVRAMNATTAADVFGER